jgi:glycosyltransferase involved in cell wall biosynthesis
LRARFGLKKINRVMLWLGYPVPFKRVPMLLQVFRRVRLLDPEARLLLIGDLSQSKEDLPALIQQLGIQTGVITAGQIAHQDLPAYYALAHTFVMTSAYEGVPRVLMEASAAALPLVAFDVVGISEVIEDGINGYLIPNGDVVAMAARLVDLLHSPDRARVLGFSARSLGMERFSATRNPDAVAELWQQAVTLGRK